MELYFTGKRIYPIGSRGKRHLLTDYTAIKHLRFYRVHLAIWESNSPTPILMMTGTDCINSGIRQLFSFLKLR